MPNSNAPPNATVPKPSEHHLNPFVRFRWQLATHRLALAAGWTDERYVQTVERLDAQLANVGGVGFTVTPLTQLETDLARPVWAKVETGNVGGSHKARHLFGLLLQSEVAANSAASAVSPSPVSTSVATLGIASCGNAALGAAVIARSARRALDVFVPTDADPLVVDELQRLEANVVVCQRTKGSVGDPCMTALAEAIKLGTEPFTVQGPTCPGVFDGARTIGLELADQLTEVGAWPLDGPSDLYVQVGGGAFATAVMDGIDLAADDPATTWEPPRLHPVQPQRAHPYVGAWERILPRLLRQVADPANVDRPADLGRALQAAARQGEFDQFVADADDVMLPWPTTPTSVATGILDDVTYDWRPLMLHQLRSGGWPLLPSEADLSAATSLAAGQVTPPPDATGAAGLAGALIDDEAIDSKLAVIILSGVDRAWEYQQR